MSIEIKRKTINNTVKFAIVILVILVLGIIGIFGTKAVIRNLKINEIKNKMSVIDSKELQKKIEEELKNTKLYIEKDVDNLYVGSMINEGVEAEGYTCISILAMKAGGNMVGAVEVPCFKIESDNNGNFKSIEYTDTLFNGYGSAIITDAIMKVFKDNYEIDFKEIKKDKKIRNKFFKEELYEYTNKGEIYIYDNNFLIGVLNIVADINLEYGDSIKGLEEYKTKTFGLDI